jgi:hypothetical protein
MHLPLQSTLVAGHACLQVRLTGSQLAVLPAIGAQSSGAQQAPQRSPQSFGVPLPGSHPPSAAGGAAGASTTTCGASETDEPAAPPTLPPIPDTLPPPEPPLPPPPLPPEPPDRPPPACASRRARSVSVCLFGSAHARPPTTHAASRTYRILRFRIGVGGSCASTKAFISPRGMLVFEPTTAELRKTRGANARRKANFLPATDAGLAFGGDGVREEADDARARRP